MAPHPATALERSPVSNALPLMPIPAAPSSETRRPLMPAPGASRFSANTAVQARSLRSRRRPPPAGQLRSAAPPRSTDARAHPRTTPERMMVARERIRAAAEAGQRVRSYEVALDLDLSEFHFARQFRAAFGRSPTSSTTRSAPSALAPCSAKAWARARSPVASASAARPSSAPSSPSAASRRRSRTRCRRRGSCVASSPCAWGRVGRWASP